MLYFPKSREYWGIKGQNNEKIDIIIIIIVIMMIVGCVNPNSNQSQQSKINSSLPAASANTASKDDAYYENLIKDIKYPEIYLVKSDAELMDVIRMFVGGFDIVLSDDQFSSPQELGDNKIFYYLTSLLIFDEFPESQEINNTDVNGVHFYKQETIEKYAYYFFNYKIDCTKIDGWSEEKQGVYRVMEGFGGGRPEPECQLKEIEPGKYQFTAVYISGEEFKGATDSTITAILGVEEARVYFISLQRVYGK